VKHHIANLTLGFRYDKHSAFGSAFVPRFALTNGLTIFTSRRSTVHAYRPPALKTLN
jgi:outer membrane receptor for ferrienterochelin and colicin